MSDYSFRWWHFFVVCLMIFFIKILPVSFDYKLPFTFTCCVLFLVLTSLNNGHGGGEKKWFKVFSASLVYYVIGWVLLVFSQMTGIYPPFEFVKIGGVVLIGVLFNLLSLHPRKVLLGIVFILAFFISMGLSVVSFQNVSEAASILNRGNVIPSEKLMAGRLNTALEMMVALCSWMFLIRLRSLKSSIN